MIKKTIRMKHNLNEDALGATILFGCLAIILGMAILPLTIWAGFALLFPAAGITFWKACGISLLIIVVTGLLK